MTKCKQCVSEMRVQGYEHVTDVAGVLVRDASGTAPVCPECGAVELPLSRVRRYEQRAAATAMRETAEPSGAMVRYARRALGKTQVELADLLGCAPETVSRWETGSVPIPAAMRLALVALLDMAFYAPAAPAKPGELVVPNCAA
jgi:DNA-binding transcriptional regulator YiaG